MIKQILNKCKIQDNNKFQTNSLKMNLQVLALMMKKMIKKNNNKIF